MRESHIENAVRKHAKALGWRAEKVNTVNDRGRPDRRFSRAGRYFYIEFKAPGEKLRPKQEDQIRKMRAEGDTVYVVDNIQQGKDIVERHAAQVSDAGGCLCCRQP